MGAIALKWLDQDSPQSVRSQINTHIARVASNLRCAPHRKSSRGADAQRESYDHEGPQDREASNPSASLIAWHGNSDPFQSQAITITPVVNQLLTFLLHVWDPALHIKAANSLAEWFWSGLRHKATQNHIAAFQHGSHAANAILLQSAAVLSVVCPGKGTREQRTVLKLGIMAQLRVALRSEHTQQTDDKLWLAAALFIDAVCAQDFSEAQSHGEALQHLMRLKTEAEGFSSLDQKIFSEVLLYELYRSNLTLTRPVIDVDVWAPSVVDAHTQPVDDLSKHLRPRLIQELDQSVRNTPLEGFCVDFRQGQWLALHGLCLKPKLSPSIICEWAPLHSRLAQLQGINYFVQARHLAQQHDPESLDALHWQAQACIALGLLLSQVNHVADPYILGIPYWPRARRLAETLQYHMQQAMRGVRTLSTDPRFTRPLLFAAWAGATWSYREHLALENPASLVFYQTFGLLATLLEVKTWEVTVAIIDSFMPFVFTLFQQDTPFPAWLMSSLDQNVEASLQ